jgi:hypothetical protein
MAECLVKESNNFALYLYFYLLTLDNSSSGKSLRVVFCDESIQLEDRAMDNVQNCDSYVI